MSCGDRLGSLNNIDGGEVDVVLAIVLLFEVLYCPLDFCCLCLLDVRG